jgi:murein DD-endopeptidase MepM/ murein hydrolase activator NlpD
MPEEKPEKKRRLPNLRRRFRLVLMNEDTLEESATFSLRLLNVFVFTGLTVILLITLTTLLIALTPLKEYIPGYADVDVRRRVLQLVLKADSLERALNARDEYITNIRDIVNGTVSTALPAKTDSAYTRYDTVQALRKSLADSMLRQEIESQSPLTLHAGQPAAGISSFLFFPPVKGAVTSRFDAATKHFGIDIVAGTNEPVKATLDGTVVLSNFTSETGYVLAIQHGNNLLSFYKHNSALLRKTGDFVKAGEVVAIIGNTGELSTGPHLHFELWFNGTPIDPSRYIPF